MSERNKKLLAKLNNIPRVTEGGFASTRTLVIKKTFDCSHFQPGPYVRFHKRPITQEEDYFFRSFPDLKYDYLYQSSEQRLAVDKARRAVMRHFGRL